MQIMGINCFQENSTTRDPLYAHVYTYQTPDFSVLMTRT